MFCSSSLGRAPVIRKDRSLDLLGKSQEDSEKETADLGYQIKGQRKQGFILR